MFNQQNEIFMLESLISRLALFFLGRLPPRILGKIHEQLLLKSAGADPRIGEYALECNNPQALRFLIDAYPTLEKIFSTYPRMGEIRFLDIGPAFGASAGLLSQMHRSHFLGPKLKVDVLDIVDDRKSFIELGYPLVEFIHSTIEELPPEKTWDIAYCSNVIEHMEDPASFLSNVARRVSGHVVVLAPYREAHPLSPGHLVQIDEQTFDGFDVKSIQVIQTPAWPITADGVERKQILAVLAGSAA